MWLMLNKPLTVIFVISFVNGVLTKDTTCTNFLNIFKLFLFNITLLLLSIKKFFILELTYIYDEKNFSGNC